MIIKKCGIIVRDQSQKYLLVFGKKSGKWSFPKGHQEEGETEEDTALRELKEETGICFTRNDLEDRIRFKNNIYFNVTSSSSGDMMPIHIQDTNEILKTSWFSLPEMLELSKETINYGLKSWLNHMLANDHSIRHTKFVHPMDSLKSTFTGKPIGKYYPTSC
jgi:8-oxo-dGTP pyrophosphatase MutT (NUDIX family)|uniref:Nudix hydrolase domain-containing protein n=1 Tax=viral metagenome TaxID=1070528 RepID=A0A6C0K664_9ZZZZ